MLNCPWPDSARRQDPSLHARQLFPVKPGQLVESFPALGGRVDPNKTVVSSGPFFADQPSPLRPINEPDNGVVPRL